MPDYLTILTKSHSKLTSAQFRPIMKKRVSQ